MSIDYPVKSTTKLIHQLNKSSRSNSSITTDYINAMQIEMNLSRSYRELNAWALTKLSQFHKNKPFNKISRKDILSFLNSFRKTDSQDPLHKWIGTYNLTRLLLMRFFKWLYYPDEEHSNRPKPKIIENIPKYKRKEQSIYKPTDLWTQEDDLLFLKYCPNTRDRCYHTISRDTSCRPHEILNLKIKDIVFKTSGDRQYAEVLVNGKTGTRHIPLIDSLPYIKDWLDQHPRRNNPNTYFICSRDRKHFAQQLQIPSLRDNYKKYKLNFFPKLLDDPHVLAEDKQKIRDLLNKPWNPYIRRHSSLTAKSKFLHGSIFNQHAGWSPRSQMHLKYLHYFGNESSESILEAYGIITKDQKGSTAMRSKQCPNCNEPNKPDSRFCAKCRMVLTYDAYSETIDEKQTKDKQIEEMMRKQEQFEQLIQSLIDSGELKPKNELS
jgi:integrase/recombinase XerD